MVTTTVNATAPPVRSPAALDHLSWSGIQAYTTCPSRFRFRYIEEAPEEFIPSALAFGHAFHTVYQHVQQSRLEGLGVPGEAELLDAYDMGWQEETHGEPPILFNKDEGAVTLRELAARMIFAYRQFAVGEPPGGCIIAIEEELRFRLLAEVPEIEMRLDLLEVRGDDLIVTDLKTSRSSWNEEKVRENLPQLVLYAHGLMPLVHDLGIKRVVPRFLVVTKAKNPRVQTLEPKATRDDAQKLRHHVADVWAAIQAGVFVKHEGWQCTQCPYRGRCLGS